MTGTTTRRREPAAGSAAGSGRGWATNPAGPLLLFAVLRLPVVLAASAPEIVPDETGSWAIGRWLSGMRPLIEMNEMPDYALVPGALLAPLNWIPVDPSTRYRLALVVASLLVVASAFLIRGAVAVLTGDRGLSAAAFAITLLFPATFLTSLFTWAEASVLLCVAAFVRGLVACLLSAGPPPRATILATGFVAGAAPYVHGRLAVVPIVWLALLGWVTARRPAHLQLAQSPRGSLVAGAAMATVTALALHLLDRAAEAAVWTDPRAGEDAVVSGLLEPGNWPDVLRAGTGQLWYAAVASAGLAIVGVAMGVRAVARTKDPALRHLTLTLGACGLGVAATSAAFISRTVGNVGGDQRGRMGGIRWDHLVYGRYIDVVVLLATIAGVCALALWPAGRSRMVMAVAAATTGGTAVLLGGWWHDAALDASIRPTTAGLAVLAEADTSLPLLRASMVAVLAILALSALVGARRRFLFGLVGILLCVGAALAARTAVGIHGSSAAPLVHEDLPGPRVGVAEVVVPAELDERMPYVLLWSRMQVMAAPLGWHLEFSRADSVAVAADPPADAGMVVLPNSLGPPSGPGAWQVQWADDLVSLWVDTEPTGAG